MKMVADSRESLVAPAPSTPIDRPQPTTQAVMINTVIAAGYDHSPLPQLIIDPYSGVIVHANPAAEQLFRIRHVSLIGCTADQLYPRARGELYVFTEEAIARGQAVTRSLKLLRPDGNPFRLEYTGVYLELKGKHYFLVTITDLDQLERRSVNEEAESWHRKGVKEWRKAEHFYGELERENQLIFAAAGEGIYGVNADGVTTFLNPAAQKMLGYSAAELVGKEMHGMIHSKKADGSEYPQTQCPIYNAFRQRTVKTVDDEVFWCKNGKPLRVEYTSTPIVDSGAVIGAVIVFRDISKRKHDEEQLRAVLADNARLRERLELENAYLQEEIREHVNHYNIIGSSESLQHTLSQIDLVADTDASVMITGESGTGKELVAHGIHQASKRNKRPLIRVNCAAIPRELFESEFFGHVRGAFSGALRDRIGRFELADGGTIFLDEVGEIPLDLQSKLLRVLQERCFERVGEEKTRKVDVRLIAATNRNLKTEVSAGRFREDLYFRLNVFPIDCKALRDRPSDIALLAAHFLDKMCTHLNIKKLQLTKAHIHTLTHYTWPGNVRELQNVIERAAILAQSGRLAFDLPESDRRAAAEIHGTRTPAGNDDTILTAAQISTFEHNNIRRALAACAGRVSGSGGAAALLGMKPTTLYSRLKTMD